MPGHERWEAAQRAMRRDVQRHRRQPDRARVVPEVPLDLPDLTIGRRPALDGLARAPRRAGVGAVRWLAQRVAGPVLVEQSRYNARLAAQVRLQGEEIARLSGALAASRRGEPGDDVDRRFNAFDYLAFENRFRGSEDAIGARQAEYADYFHGGAGQILDIGCGRGEFVELLGRRGLPARGIDASAEMVAHARAKGLDVVCGEATEHLRRQPAGVLGGVFLSQVVEHLETAELTALLREIGRTCAEGAVLVVETLNPESWPVLSRWFWLDPSHVRLVHPETLQFLVDQAGFDVKTVQHRNGADAGVPVPPAPEPGSANGTREPLADLRSSLEALNRRLFAMTDYFVVGTRRR